jgi:hypothetical protein
MKKAPANVPASVHQRLLNRAKREDRPLNELLPYFAIERFLYRLSRSSHADKLVLKGALMLRIWHSPLARPTMDVDFLARAVSSPDDLVAIVKQCFAEDVPDDGMRFDPDSVTTEAIAEDAVYQGVRVRFTAHLSHIPIGMQVDVGFGDAVVPAPTWAELPALLDLPAPRLLTYPPEASVAEKFEAMVELEMANSRMKDFYDIWTLARIRDFDGSTLARALRATFQRRQRVLPAELPVALTAAFADDATKQAQWRAFVRRSRLDATTPPLADVVAVVRDFLGPPARAVAAGEAFERVWPASGPWRPVGTKG